MTTHPFTRETGAPLSWPDSMTAHWPSLRLDLRVFLVRREKQMHERISADGKRFSQLEAKVDAIMAGALSNAGS